MKDFREESVISLNFHWPKLDIITYQIDKLQQFSFSGQRLTYW